MSSLKPVLLALALLTVVQVVPSPLAAQQFAVSAADGVVLSLPGGRLAILMVESGRVMVANVMGGEAGGAPAIDIAAGDRVTRFLHLVHPSLGAIQAALDTLPTGAEVRLGITRGTAAERVVRYAKPKPEQVMAVRGAAGGAGAWTTGGGISAVEEVVLAGVHVRNNDQGMPAVTHRTTHPAGSTVALRVGDVITAVNGRSLAALAGLELFLNEIKAGDPVRLTVTRGSETITVTFAKPN